MRKYILAAFLVTVVHPGFAQYAASDAARAPISAPQSVITELHVVEVSLTKLGETKAERYGGPKDMTVAELLSDLQSAHRANTKDKGPERASPAGEKLAALVETLSKDCFAASLAQPHLLTISGRPGYLLVGGELPCRTKDAQGNEVISFKEYGTRADVVANAQSGERIHLDLRVRISQPDGAYADMPVLKVREMETALELRPGQTVALDGGIERRQEAVIGANNEVHEISNRVQMFVLVRASIVEKDDNGDHSAKTRGTAMSSSKPTRR
jgi:Flp pilus assembly secretin CpaC